MATGDAADFLARTKAVLPGAWFPGSPLAQDTPTPTLDAALAGPAWGASWLYGLLQYVAEQHRIETATDSNLDLIGLDYFGKGLIRRLQEGDGGYRARILANLLAPRGTRGAVISVLTTLTGNVPAIFEPTRPADTGGWGDIATGQLNTALAYGMVGGWGDMLIPAQFFVKAYRPAGGGVSLVDGWGQGAGGWGVGAIEYGSMSYIANEVTDADIYAAVNLSRPAGTTAWVSIAAGQIKAPTAPPVDEPVLAPVMPITVIAGSSIVLALSATDPAYPPSQLIYRIAAAPTSGVIQVNGTTASIWTQAEMSARLVTYVSTGLDAASDSVSFTVSNPAGSSIDGTLSITITATAPPPPPPPGSQLDIDFILDVSPLE